MGAEDIAAEAKCGERFLLTHITITRSKNTIIPATMSIIVFISEMISNYLVKTNSYLHFTDGRKLLYQSFEQQLLTATELFPTMNSKILGEKFAL